MLSTVSDSPSPPRAPRQAAARLLGPTRHTEIWHKVKQGRGSLQEQQLRAGQKGKGKRESEKENGKHHDYLCDEIQDFPGTFSMD